MSSSKAGLAGIHLVRYSIPADQKYLLGQFLKTYDQLVVNANMLAHAPLALSDFLSRQSQKPYLIDPQTHAFQHGVQYLLSESKASQGKIKRSWRKLIDVYGEPLKKCILVEGRSVTPKDFRSSTVVGSFCNGVLAFQLNTVTGQLTNQKDSKYLKFVSKAKGTNLSHYPPSLLVAPYFYLEEANYEAWLPINLSCLSSFIQNRPSKALVAAQIVISRPLLRQADAVNAITSSYAKISPKPDYILLWVDEFSEHTAGLNELYDWHLLLGRLCEIAPVINLYGGFLSTLLARFSEKGRLVGVCHGPEFGETRQVVPVGGGLSVAKFYLNALHHRLSPRFAVQAIRALGGMDNSADYFSCVCDCAQCRATIHKDPENDALAYFESKSSAFWSGGRRVIREFPTASASDICTKHYMYCKSREFSQTTSLETVMNDLKKAGRQLSGPLGFDITSHTTKWPKFFEQIESNNAQAE